MKQIPIEAEGKEPSPKELVEIVQHGRKLGIPVVFVQPQFSQKSAKVIASEMGAKVVPLDPLARIGMRICSRSRQRSERFAVAVLQ